MWSPLSQLPPSGALAPFAAAPQTNPVAAQVPLPANIQRQVLNDPAAFHSALRQWMAAKPQGGIPSTGGDFNAWLTARNSWIDSQPVYQQPGALGAF